MFVRNCFCYSVNIKNGGILEFKGVGSTAYLGGSGNGFTLSIDKNGSKIILNDSYIVNLSGGHERVLSELKKYASEADEEKVAVVADDILDIQSDPLTMTLQYQYIVSFQPLGSMNTHEIHFPICKCYFRSL